MTNLPGLTFVIAVTALVFALWPVVADAPREDGVTRYTPGRFLSSGDVYRQFERHRKDVEFDIWWVGVQRQQEIDDLRWDLRMRD